MSQNYCVRLRVCVCTYVFCSHLQALAGGHRAGVVAAVVLVADVQGKNVPLTALALVRVEGKLLLAAHATQVLQVRLVCHNIQLVHLADRIGRHEFRHTVHPAVDRLVNIELLVEALLLHPRLGGPEAEVVQGNIRVQEGKAVREPEGVEEDNCGHDGAWHRLNRHGLQTQLLNRAHLEPVHVTAVRVAGEEAGSHALRQQVVAEAIKPMDRLRDVALHVAGASAIVDGAQKRVATHGLQQDTVVHQVRAGDAAGNLERTARHLLARVWSRLWNTALVTSKEKKKKEECFCVEETRGILLDLLGKRSNTKKKKRREKRVDIRKRENPYHTNAVREEEKKKRRVPSGVL